MAATSLPELAGLPDDLTGFARAVVRLRDANAPNVQLAYHISVWGTRIDILHSKPPDAEVIALGQRAAAFYLLSIPVLGWVGRRKTAQPA